VEISYSANNQEVVDKFRTGQIDLAYLGPLPYITLKKTFPTAEPVVVFLEENGQASYTCALVVLADSKLNLKKLKGKKIALTQPLSTCGYFTTQGLLHDLGSSLEANLYRYLGQHDEVALAVVRGEFDAGGLKTAIARKYTHLGLEVRAESPPLPGLAIIANGNRVSPERIAQIRQILLSADDKTRQQWGDNVRYGVISANDGNYDVLRQMSMPANIPEQGNF
jgi:phosphonate transport system substrate-binding protein